MSKYRKNPEAPISSLSPEQFRVTQESATERPFRERLFDQRRTWNLRGHRFRRATFLVVDKFDSHCGWPSFTKPLESQNVDEREDSSWHGRTEVRSVTGTATWDTCSDDGPRDKGGLRYCINSASLRFIPVDELEGEGYGEYKKLFDQQ